MSNRDRNQSGRFTGSRSTRPRPSAADFDLLASLRTLFRTAEKAADFTGAASIARVLRDLDEGDDGSDEDELDNASRINDHWLLDEREELRLLLVAVKRLQNRVRARMGRPEVPIRPSLLEPELPPGPPRVYTVTQPAPPKPDPVAEDPMAALTTPVIEEVDPFEGYDANDDCEYGPPRFITRRQP